MFQRISTALPAALLAVCMAAPAAAETGLYGGVQYTYFDLSEEGVDDDALFDGLGVRLGYQLSDIVGVELRTGTGLGTDDVDIGTLGFRAEVELDYYAGAYVRAGYPVSETVSAYAIAGFTHAEFSSELLGANLTLDIDLVDSESDVSYGLGIDVTANEDITLNLEVMRYMDTGDIKIDGASFGMSFRF